MHKSHFNPLTLLRDSKLHYHVNTGHLNPLTLRDTKLHYRVYKSHLNPLIHTDHSCVNISVYTGEPFGQTSRDGGSIPTVITRPHGDMSTINIVMPTQHNATQHNTTQHNTTQHNTTRHDTTRHNTTQHDRTQHNTTHTVHLQYITLRWHEKKPQSVHKLRC